MAGREESWPPGCVQEPRGDRGATVALDVEAIDEEREGSAADDASRPLPEVEQIVRPLRLAEATEAAGPARTLTGRSARGLRELLVAVDLLSVCVGWLLARAVTGSLPGDLGGFGILVAETVAVLAVFLLLMSANGLYRRRICQVRSVEAARILRTTSMICLLLVSWTVIAGHLPVLAVGVAGIAWPSLLLTERSLMREWIRGQRAQGAYGAPVLVVGGDPVSSAEVADFLGENPVLGFEVQGIVGVEPDGPGTFPWLGPLDDLVEVARTSGSVGAVLDARSLNGQLSKAVSTLTALNLHVHVYSGLRGVERRRIMLSAAADETMLYVAPLGLEHRQRVAKRVLDVGVASVLLLLSSPILVAAALAIRLQDGGPFLFRQERIGHQGEPFTLYKLRTMTTDADGHRHELAARNQRQGPLFKVSDDPRVTGVGRLLRALSLDELPQLLNVLEGTMSMVGPRPALPEEVAQFDEELGARLSVNPGVTGFWQVEARDLPSFDLYRRYDLLYVQNWSVGVDVAVICRTGLVVFVRGLRLLLPRRWRRRPAEVLE